MWFHHGRTFALSPKAYCFKLKRKVYYNPYLLCEWRYRNVVNETRINRVLNVPKNTFCVITVVLLKWSRLKPGSYSNKQYKKKYCTRDTMLKILKNFIQCILYNIFYHGFVRRSRSCKSARDFAIDKLLNSKHQLVRYYSWVLTDVNVWRCLPIN